MHRLFRRFGVLASDRTPCGKPLPLAHAHALMTLLARGELSQRELAAELCIDKSNVTRLCARLVESGHVVQRTAEHDARSRRVALTADGQRLAREVEQSGGARFAALLAAIPAGSRRDVLRSLRLLTDALESLPAIAESENE